MTSIDAHSAVRNLVENAFTHLTWHENVCQETGFKGISPIWKEEPAWYFWSDRVSGSFLLRFHAEESIEANQYISLSLHYFPTIDEDAYRKLSAGEKWLLSDKSVFDPVTNSPEFEAYEQFITSFLVAELGLVVDSDNNLQVLLYSSDKQKDHPLHQFLDLLIRALNFQSGKHHLQAYHLQDNELSSTFLSYSQRGFEEFLQAFDIDIDCLDELLPNDELKSWQHAAHMEAVCSMTGSCNCSH